MPHWLLISLIQVAHTPLLKVKGPVMSLNKWIKTLQLKYHEQHNNKVSGGKKVVYVSFPVIRFLNRKLHRHSERWKMVRAFRYFKVLPWGPKVKSQNVDRVIMCFVYLGAGIFALWISEHRALQKTHNSSLTIKVVTGALSPKEAIMQKTNAAPGSPNRPSW